MSGLGIFDPLLNRQRTDDTKTVHISGGGSNQAPVAGGSSGGGTPGGSDTQIQFNDGGSFGGDSGLVFNKTTNALTLDGDFTIAGTLPSYWIFTNSPRIYSGTDYYGSGITMLISLRLSNNTWVTDTVVGYDDGTTSIPVPTWTTGWDSIYVHLCDATGLGGGKITVYSSEDWATTSAYYDTMFGAGMITLDHTPAGTIDYSSGVWTDNTGLAICADSGSTNFVDPFVMTGVVNPRLTIDQDGSTTHVGNFNIGFGGLTVSGTQQIVASDSSLSVSYIQTDTSVSTFNEFNNVRIYGEQLFNSFGSLYLPYDSGAGNPGLQSGVKVWTDTDTDEQWLYWQEGGAGNKKVHLHDEDYVDLVTAAFSSNTTADQAARVYLGNATSGNITLTLPAASTSAGLRYYVKKTDSSANTVTVDGNASETIDGATTKVLTAQYDKLQIICDGSAWWII